MKKFSLLFVMLLVSVAVFAKGELKTVVYTTTPVMHCEGCENKIKNELKFVKGIKKIETSVENQTVTITYDAKKTSTDKIEAAFANIKYTVKRVDLPTEGCKMGEGCKMNGCGNHEGCGNGEGCGKHEGCAAEQGSKQEMNCCKEKK